MRIDVASARAKVSGVEQMVDVPGAQLWTTTQGGGRPLLLFNGGPGCDDYLGDVSAMLDDLCQVIRFEPRGCGRSDWDGRYDLDTLLSDAEAVRVAHGVDRIIVGGHSAGPNFALAYALRYRDHVRGLVGVAGGNLLNDRQWSAAYHEGLERAGEDNGGKQYHADPDVNSKGATTWREYIKRPSLLRDVAALDIPCVFINGQLDIRPNWPTEQLANLLPNGRYVEIEGAAHYIWVTHPEALRRELRNAVSAMI